MKVILTTLIWALVFALAYLAAGCALHESKEVFRILIPPDNPQIVLEYGSKVWGGSVLSFFKVRQVSRTTPLSELFIGDMEYKPDPNTLNALAEGIIDSLMKGN